VVEDQGNTTHEGESTYVGPDSNILCRMCLKLGVSVVAAWHTWLPTGERNNETDKQVELILISCAISCAKNCRYLLACTVTDLPCPSPKQTGSNKIVALKRCAHDFMGQQRTDDDAGLSYLESVDIYEYDTLAIGRMIAQ
jgi:hypothetical protein